MEMPYFFCYNIKRFYLSSALTFDIDILHTLLSTNPGGLTICQSTLFIAYQSGEGDFRRKSVGASTTRLPARAYCEKQKYCQIKLSASLLTEFN